MHLADLLTTSDVMLRLRARDVSGAAEQLLRRSLQRHGLAASDIDRLVLAVDERECELSTNLGAIAIPHACDDQLGFIAASIGVNAEGVISGSPEPRVVIAFVSPALERKKHLALLAEIAQLARDRGAIDALTAATSAEDVLATIRSYCSERRSASSS
ncbi:MAG: PTS sugar transporter subunit IIA [Acidobacteria bacterium]|nr:PTS sugar transporter subunit IIA [Acidobacteriota bacterium]MBV9186162.1 PTS sugar transporter subunit IIA [Acidobacteriota bacterium]